MSVLSANIDRIKELCRSHKVRTLYAFGSVLSSRFNTESDVDMIVSFDQMDVASYADNYFDLKFSLEELLKRSVDLLEDNAITNPYFRQAVDPQRQMIYGH